VELPLGPPYVSNNARSDPRLVAELVELIGALSLVLVPMVSEGRVLGLIAPQQARRLHRRRRAAALDLRRPRRHLPAQPRDLTGERRHSARLERMAELGATWRRRASAPLLSLTVARIQQDFECASVTFHAATTPRTRCCAEARPAPGAAGRRAAALRARGSRPLRGAEPGRGILLAVPVRAGEQALGARAAAARPPVSARTRRTCSRRCRPARRHAGRTPEPGGLRAWRGQMATLYDVGLETSRCATCGRCHEGDRGDRTPDPGRSHLGVPLDEPSGNLVVFAAWARVPSREATRRPSSGWARARRAVAVDLKPAMVNDSDAETDFVAEGQPGQAPALRAAHVLRPRARSRHALGVAERTRRPGEPRFTQDDLEYLSASPASSRIAVANAMAFAAERERSERSGSSNTLIARSPAASRASGSCRRRLAHHEAFLYPA